MREETKFIIAFMIVVGFIFFYGVSLVQAKLYTGNNQTFDDFADGSIDNTKWYGYTEGTCGSSGSSATTEETAGVSLGISATLGSAGGCDNHELYNGTNSVNFNNKITIIMDIGANQAGKLPYLYFVDSSNSHAVNLEINQIGREKRRYEVYPNTNTIRKYGINDLIGNGSYTSYDISSLNDNEKWGIRMSVTGSGSNGQSGSVTLYSLFYGYPNATVAYQNKTSPVDNTFYGSASNNFIVNTTIDNSYVASNYSLSNITYYFWSMDGSIYNKTTYQISGIANITNKSFNLDIGNYYWNIHFCINDSNSVICDMPERNFTYTYGFTINNITYQNTVYETQNNNFVLNVTFGSNPLSLSGNLIYNNKIYPSTITCSSLNCLVSNSIDIPLANINGQNNSFYWNISYYSGSNKYNINSLSNNQTVNQINLYKCYSYPALNFTIYDQTNLSLISPYKFQSTFNYWLGSGSTYKNYTINDLSATNESICIDKDLTYYVNANMAFGATGYIDSTYFLNNASITNSTNNLDLYLLSIADSTSFIDRVIDYGRNPIANALIYIQRCDTASNCITVQIARTDLNGETIGVYKAETVDYKHIIIKDGEIIYTDEPHKIFATSSPYTNEFFVGETASISFNYTLPNLFESLTFNSTTNLVTYTFIDTSGLFSLGRLLVELTNYSTSNSIICNETSIQSSATITCNMSSSPEASYEASGFITREDIEKLVDYITFTLSNAKDIFGYEGLFLGMLIIITASMAFLYHPIAGTWMTTGAMIFTNIIGFTSFTMVWIFGAIILSLIFTWFFRE